MKATTDTQHYEDIANAINYSKDGTQYTSDLTKARSALAEDASKFDDIDRNLEEINGKLEGVNLNNVGIGVMDFVNDDITIISGGLESLGRKITT